MTMNLFYLWMGRLVFLVAWIFVTTHAAATESYQETTTPTSCSLPPNGSHPELQKCYRMGNTLLNNYVDYMRRREGAYLFDKCTNYFDFWRCLNPWIRNCNEVAKNATRDWGVLTNSMYCSCTRNRECVEKINCFEDQFNNVLFKRCDALYKFNIQQKTLDKCHFLNDNIQCWTNLMSTACGAEMGELARLIAMHRKRKHARKHGCNVKANTASTEYDDFKFSASCPTNLTTTLDQCHNQHTSHGRRLYFFDSNDKVSDGNAKDVRRACRDYAKYKSCTDTLRNDCPQGLEAVYQYEYRLRTYNLKMDIICSHQHYEVYKTSLKCYQDVFLDNHLKGCVPIWIDDVQPVLDRTRAYQYYCQNSSDARLLNRRLKKYIACYNTTFRGRCGQEAGDTMTALLQHTFTDPHYLMFRFRPQCRLHGNHLDTSREQEGDKTKEVHTEKPQNKKKTKDSEKEESKNNDSGHYSHVTNDTSNGGCSSLHACAVTRPIYAVVLFVVYVSLPCRFSKLIT